MHHRTGDAMHLIQLLYLMLPVYFANMAPPFVKYWRGWNRPICAPLLGSHKTIVGFGAGVLVAVIVVLIQRLVDWQKGAPTTMDWLPFGIVAGVCAMAGDSIKSFFKRRLRLAPGSRWIPFDQLDFVLAGLFALNYFVPLSWIDVLEICIISFVADVLVNQLSFALSIRDTKW